MDIIKLKRLENIPVSFRVTEVQIFSKETQYPNYTF